MKIYWLILSLSVHPAWAAKVPAISYVRGVNLSEVGVHRYCASEPGDPKMEAQLIIDKLYRLGVRHIAISPRAVMKSPSQSFVELLTPEDQRIREKGCYLRLIDYIHSLGMTAAIRPLLFVVDNKLNPFTEFGRPLPAGGVWWHGNIMPENPAAWFQSFQSYLDIYAAVARSAHAEEFTIGAELHSMTVGLDSAPRPYTCGFPRRWVALLAHIRSRLPGVRLMYDINFTDAEIFNGRSSRLGGEFALWCQRIANPGFAPSKLPVGKNPLDSVPPGVDPYWSGCWSDLITFWRSLDGIGLDFYRSLASPHQIVPDSCPELTAVLKRTSDRFATEIDNCLSEVASVVGVQKPLTLKDVGYRSVVGGYLDPYQYASKGGVYNGCHQAASYEAIFLSLWQPHWPWFHGIVWWDAPVDIDRHGEGDCGFSPIGKPETESVLRKYFGK